MNTSAWSGLIETKTLLLSLIFGAASSIIAEFRQWFQLWYLYNFNITSVQKFSVYNIVIGGYSSLQGILFFVALYYVAGRNFPSKAPAILGSLIPGVILGEALGGILGYAVFASIPNARVLPAFNYAASLPAALARILSYVTSSWGMILSGLLPIFAAWGVREWDRRLKQAGLGLPSERPSGLQITAIMFGILGVLTFCVLPFLYLQPAVFPSASLVSLDLVLASVFISFLVTLALVVILLSYGTYNGTRWGWIAGFASTAILLGVNIDILAGLLIIPSSSGTNILAPGGFVPILIVITTLVSIALATVTLLMLPQKRFRDYCRIIGPPEMEPTKEPTNL